jgi:hypothetical protein
VITLSELYIYPVKSAAGTAATRATVDSRGLAGDRRWMVVDEQREFLTQRSHPRLALISVIAYPDRLALAAPGMPPLTVAAPAIGAPTMPVQVWGDVCDAVPAVGEPASWLSGFLGETVDLVYMPDATRREVVRESGDPPALVGFADGFPFLLLSEASLDDLNRRMATPLPMDRFRPNLVVRGCDPYAEDSWRRIRIGEIAFDVVKPCSRCSTTTVDQLTGERGKEPLATLARYRRVGTEVMFGQNLIHAGEGELCVDDEVTVIEAA